MKTLRSRLVLSVVTMGAAILLGLLVVSASYKSAIARADDEAAGHEALMKNALSFERRRGNGVADLGQ